MTTVINGDTGIDKVQDGSIGTVDIAAGAVTQAKLGTNVVGNGPYLSVWQNVAQSITNGAGTTVIFDQEEYDTANAYNPATGLYTPQVAGFYQVNIRLQFAVATYSVGIQLGKNGSIYKYLSVDEPTGNGAINGSAVVYLNGTTDYLHAIGYSGTPQNSTTGATITWMQAVLVRAA